LLTRHAPFLRFAAAHPSETRRDRMRAKLRA